MKGITPMKQRLYFIFASSVMLVLLATGCSRDNEAYQPSEEEVMANAEDVLGVKISSDLDWNMTASARARITVNGNYGETFTVKIYSNDPLVEKKGYVLKRGQVESGGTLEMKFEYPAANEHLVVGVTDSRSLTSYKTVSIINGVLETTFGGDGTETAEARGPVKSRTKPSVPDMKDIPTSEYAKSFLVDAQEPGGANLNTNNKTWHEGTPDVIIQGQFSVDPGLLDSEDQAWYEANIQPFIDGDKAHYNAVDMNEAWEKVVQLLEQTGRRDWLVIEAGDPGYWEYGEGHADHFKVTSEWAGTIQVMGSENDYARTMYVSGKWIVNGWQEVGGGAVIVVDEGGELVISEGQKMTFKNQARLVVMPGGKVSGGGTLLVTNGNTVGKESYNGGDINVGTFNNNYGKFYNYGTLRTNLYAAGAGESNIYNHGLVHIKSTGQRYNYQSSSARIFNACQWYCDESMRAFIIEGTQGSYFYVGGDLEMSDEIDGTDDHSYVALANGALMHINGALFNINCDWIGPSKGAAVLEVNNIKKLDWTGSNPVERGYFINNLSITIENFTSPLEYQQVTGYDMLSLNLVNGGANKEYQVGNGGADFVEKNQAKVIIPADYDFRAGEAGCTPGYQGVSGGLIEDEVPAVWTYAFEDTPLGDYDMNDVVIKVSENVDDPTLLDVRLCCAGASFDLYVYLGETAVFYGKEVHDALGQARGTLINTGNGPEVDIDKITPSYITKPEGFTFADADFWIKSPVVPEGIHIAKKGKAPLGVAIPGDWQWPREFVCIKEVYPNFVKFAENVEDVEAREWYKVTETDSFMSKIYVKGQ